jgi:hypothetical protein
LWKNAFSVTMQVGSSIAKICASKPQLSEIRWGRDYRHCTCAAGLRAAIVPIGYVR